MCVSERDFRESLYAIIQSPGLVCYGTRKADRSQQKGILSCLADCTHACSGAVHVPIGRGCQNDIKPPECEFFSNSKAAFFPLLQWKSESMKVPQKLEADVRLGIQQGDCPSLTEFLLCVSFSLTFALGARRTLGFGGLQRRFQQLLSCHTPGLHPKRAIRLFFSTQKGLFLR